jgi:hypothetical protein
LFENAYSVYPESIKGLFSVLCSRYPAFDTRAEDYARIRTPSIAEVLAGDGCRTALFHSGRFMYLGMNAVIQRRGFETLGGRGRHQRQLQLELRRGRTGDRRTNAGVD